MINPALIDQIDKYLLGQMSVEETQLFFQQLKANPGEQKVFELIQNIGPAYQSEKVAALKAKMQSWENDIPSSPKSDLQLLSSNKNAPILTKRSWLAAAAVGLILIAATLFLLQNEPDLTGNQLFTQHFEPYPYAGIERSAGIDRTNQAYILYNAGQFEGAKTAFSELDDIQAKFFLAQAEMALKEYQPAISHLNYYLKNGGPFQSQAKWSLALAHLALNMQGEAKIILSSLATENSSYGKKAISLIAQMK